MLFAVLLTLGKSQSVSSLLMLALLIVDLHQWLDESWKKSVKLAIKTSILYGLIFLFFIIFISLVVMTAAWIRS
jgi:hypothetical protein